MTTKAKGEPVTDAPPDEAGGADGTDMISASGESPSGPEAIVDRVVEEGRIELARLKPHPRNYRVHPADQIEEIKASIRQYGFYRNIVIARDDTILAGHGVWEAAVGLGLTEVPFKRLDLDLNEPDALKVLAGDNELSRLAEVDDRALSVILRDVKEAAPTGLLGTGFDDAMLATLVMISRPSSEVADMNEAAQWVGMPEYEGYERASETDLLIHCETAEDREKLCEQLGFNRVTKGSRLWNAWWPPRETEQPGNLMFNG